MSVLNQLASALGRRDEIPNQELAAEIAAKRDKAAVTELVENLQNKKKDIRSDCIKVLYEIAERRPALVSPYISTFVALLDSKNNRLQWGAMTALDHVTPEDPKLIYKHLSAIMRACDKGSVITRDHAVSILIHLCKHKPYADDALALLLEQFLTCPTNQLPAYAESAAAVIPEQQKKRFAKALSGRLGELEKESKRKRVEKVIEKLG